MTEISKESVVIRSLRRFRDRYITRQRKTRSDDPTLNEDCDTVEENPPSSLLDTLPVDVQFIIMTLLSPVDICRLGATNNYWRAMVRDPLLWRYFLLRDMPRWPSIDHVTMPQLAALEGPLCTADERLEDGVEGGEQQKHDIMAEYMKGCPACRQQWLQPRPPYEVVTSFLQSLVPSTEPRYAMFGHGMEQLDVSLVSRLMHTPHVLPVVGIPQRQINGIGSGISFMYNNQHHLNILTLYSNNRAERVKARVEPQCESNKLFTSDGLVFNPTLQVQEVCRAVDGFIYVANAEPGNAGEGELEAAQIRAVLSSTWGSNTRPLLVLSCISREQPDPVVTSSCARLGTMCRTPCVYIAQRLSLPQLTNPWMVQDTVAESLSGVLDGISWLLKSSGVRLYSS